MLVQKLRLQRGWSQEELSELSGVSVRTIQRLERGQTGSLDSLKALAAVFEIDFNQLKEPAMDAATASEARSHDVRPDEALALAHVRRVKGFWIHGFWYVAVTGGLAVWDLVSGTGGRLVIWPALGWGIGFAAHALSVFRPLPFLDAAWEKREAEKFLQRRL